MLIGGMVVSNGGRVILNFRLGDGGGVGSVGPAMPTRAMCDFPFYTHNMFLLIFVFRILLNGIFSILRLRNYPILSATYNDSVEGRLRKIFGTFSFFKSIFDDVCVFIFGIVIYFLTIFYFEKIQ